MPRSEPIALVHGFASSFELEWRRTGWTDLLADAGRRVITVDLLGHGVSDKPHDPVAYRSLERSLAAQLPDEPVDAVGFSLGAMCLLRLAAAEPDRFARLVVAGVGEHSLEVRDVEPTAAALDAVARGEEDVEAGELGRAFSQFAKHPDNDAAALAACLRRGDPVLTTEELGRVRATTLFVVGDRDFVGSAQPLADAVPGATVRVLRGVDHFGTSKHMGFVDSALSFLDAVPL